MRSDGLPAAVQLVGGPGSEALLCAVAGQLERALRWERHPAHFIGEPAAAPSADFGTGRLRRAWSPSSR
jgi:amidase